MIEYISLLRETLIFKNFFIVLSGLDNTLYLLIISLPIGFVLALIFALGRVSKIKLLSSVIASYIFVIRGTPLLVQIYLIYFGLVQLSLLEKVFFGMRLKNHFGVEF